MQGGSCRLDQGRDVHMHLGTSTSLAGPSETKHQVSLGPSSITFLPFLLLLLRLAVLL
jgi:hypothetical protein